MIGHCLCSCLSHSRKVLEQSILSCLHLPACWPARQLFFILCSLSFAKCNYKHRQAEHEKVRCSVSPVRDVKGLLFKKNHHKHCWLFSFQPASTTCSSRAVDWCKCFSSPLCSRHFASGGFPSVLLVHMKASGTVFLGRVACFYLYEERLLEHQGLKANRNVYIQEEGL